MGRYLNPNEPASARPCSEDTTSGSQPEGNRTIPAAEGLTKREWFAGQALLGTLAAVTSEPSDAYLAGRAVALADALIAALNGQDGAT